MTLSDEIRYSIKDSKCVWIDEVHGPKTV